MGKDNSTGRKLVTGALIAGVAGYVAGVLTAPKSGKETRKDIKDAASKAMREAEKQLKSLHSELNELLSEAKKMTADISGKRKDDLEKLTGTAKVAKERVREVLSAIHEGDVDDPDLQAAINSAKSAIRALRDFLKK